MKLFIFALLVTLLSACSSVPPKPVIKSEMPSVSYQGRGAAAGPMLMGALGPAGIAVGFAIDVGIGKDIATAMEESKDQGFQLITTRIAEQYPDVSSATLLKVDFHAQRGDDELAYATVELLLVTAEGEQSVCLQTEPGNLPELKETPISWSLIATAITARQACSSD
ncbi:MULTISPECIES: hypothetical protein [Pseudoalteromonas]|uniref:Lipoprotein n=1 Tax=Pseudoalteromonas rubra TaxID=43658 RepID=A0A5S3UYS4_9GAMM|nr:MULTISPECIES: hypothetical protein [Pseudoalteromonas]MCG7560123.1 hypothetical protein [Pseudoalteromonas sp. McH1-42]QPB85301.1 hypothetical protein CWC22_019955 [Pseudoalteromonas rubra]